MNQPDQLSSSSEAAETGSIEGASSSSQVDLDALTVTIPTFNRPQHLKRLLTYYKKVDLQTRFLILDSSEAATAAENAALVAFLGPRFRHVVFPSSLPVAAKLFEGLGLVETPYCAFCADDDLIFPTALGHALTFLASNPDYACCDGIYLNFFPSKGEINFQVEYGSRGIEAEHPGARVFRLFQRYESMFYAVFRTPDLRDLFSFVKDIPTLHYQELFQAAGAVLKGKTHRLPEFYAARQHCDAAEPTRDKWQTFYWFADDNLEFIEHYQAYRDDLWRFYEKFSAEPRMERHGFNTAMDMAHVTFFSINCPPAYFHSRLQQHWPTDAFKDMKEQDSVYDDLRPDRQLTWETTLLALLTRLERAVGRGTSSLAQRSLDKEARLLAPDGLGWSCKLNPDLWWMASVPRFREAFLELCRYLGETGEKP